jgi:hypothetical protein
MRTIIGVAGLLTALAAAAPASAQIVGRPDYGPAARSSPFLADSSLPGPTPRADVRDLRERIGAAREAGTLSRREARALDREARLIGRLAGLYGRDGLSAPERSELERRAAVLRARVNRPRS